MGMLDDENIRTTRAELLRLSPSGDLLDLAREMRDMGVESLLFCSPSGKIQQVVTDRQIAHLAAHPSSAQVVASSADVPAMAPAVDVRGPARPDPAIPRQGASAADYGAATRG